MRRKFQVGDIVRVKGLRATVTAECSLYHLLLPRGRTRIYVCESELELVRRPKAAHRGGKK